MAPFPYLSNKDLWLLYYALKTNILGIATSIDVDAPLLEYFAPPLGSLLAYERVSLAHTLNFPLEDLWGGQLLHVCHSKGDGLDD